MKWVTTPPTKPGWYWRRPGLSLAAHPAFVTTTLFGSSRRLPDVMWCFMEGGQLFATNAASAAEWSDEPIPMPEADKP